MKFLTSFLLSASLVHAAIYNVANESEFNTAVTAVNAGAGGDTVVFAAGDIPITTLKIFTQQVILQGAGVDVTRIIGTSTLAGLVDLGFSTGQVVTGITFVSNFATNGAGYCLRVRGLNYVVGNCRFFGGVRKILGISVSSNTSTPCPTGVTYQSQFFGARPLDNLGDLAGNVTWADATQVPGGANAAFTEDSYIDKRWDDGQNMWDHAYGGHSVVRYNTIVDCSDYGHGLDTTTNAERGTRFLEYYRNRTMQVRLVMGDPPVYSQSGIAVIWGNTITGTWGGSTGNFWLSLGNTGARYGNNPIDGNEPVTDGTGTHTGSNNAAVLTDATKSWTPSTFVNWTVYNLTDGSMAVITANTGTTVTGTLAGGTDNDWDTGDSYKVTNGYPLRDQPGRSTDAYQWVSDPPGAQAAAPSYEWDNTINGSNINFFVRPAGVVHVIVNRDFFNDTPMPGYTPYDYPHPSRPIVPLAAGSRYSRGRR